ncbi:PilT/PilU family type 4a pilus ATPase [Phormidium sp. CLA17]|uniref:type IV pilus twitching motility protein PilT n=1 Tax=Leptolyngbya sp. Cla-17 TaxID=2803751 RepID=UPI001491DCC4|nr:PilT/PilU family type 4a pilus ATPase [Leptolyngbya sp. Cla-17]MBM0742085.1 PilT/PilU family type 4a pilus ATPase [Leptolyngbya sp. Cla-17]
MTSSMTPRFNESSSPVPPPPPASASATIKATNSIEQMVRDAHARQASDIHIRVGEPPRFRIQGQMVLLRDQIKVTPQLFEQYLSEVLNPHQRELFAQTKELDTAVFYPGLVRCRVNCFDSLTGGAIVLRLISLDVPSIDGLGLPEVLKHLSTQSQGLILVTGPTGSGKSTTLAAMLRYMNETSSRHIVTIEDPIEYVHASQKCLISQREVGLHTLEFQNGLRAVLREDPDVILIGEMRDRVTVDTALKAAQTGHLVLGTLHTRSAINTLNRLLNIYNPDEQTTMRIQITESLVSIIAQMLIPTTDGRRTAAHEILVNTAAMQDFLVKGNESEAFQLMETGANDGMQIMNQVLCDLVLLGKISPDEAVKASPDPGDLRRRVRNEGFDPSRSSNRDFNYAQ